MKWELRLVVNVLSLCLLGVGSVTITSISVPPAVENGSKPIILDCDYAMEDHEKQGLVVKWFFRDMPVPVYQWIPGRRPQDNGPLKGRVNLEYRASEDPYRRHRAIEITRPSVELSGEYRCLVASFDNEATAAGSLVVYVPPESSSIQYSKPATGSINVTCKVQGVYPQPVLQLVRENPQIGERMAIEGETVVVGSRNGRYDVTLFKVVDERQLAADAETLFECALSLPGTAYQNTHKIAYFPGPASSALPTVPENHLDAPEEFEAEEEFEADDVSTSASPSVSAPHRSPSSAPGDAADDAEDAGVEEEIVAADHNAVWESTGRGIRAHDPLPAGSGVGLRSQWSISLLISIVAVAKMFCVSCF